MILFSQLWQAQDTAAMHEALLHLGLFERVKPPVTKTKKWGVKAAPTAPQESPSRALKLLEGLARTDEERAALLAVLDDLLHDLSHSADPFRALLNFARYVDVAAD